MESASRSRGSCNQYTINNFPIRRVLAFVVFGSELGVSDVIPLTWETYLSPKMLNLSENGTCISTNDRYLLTIAFSTFIMNTDSGVFETTIEVRNTRDNASVVGVGLLSKVKDKLRLAKWV